MEKTLLAEFAIDYVEIYTAMAKPLAYWHTHALGFTLSAWSGIETGRPGFASYVIDSGNIRLLLTTVYPMGSGAVDQDAAAFIARNYCGVKRVALRVPAVKPLFEKCIANGAIPVTAPTLLEDEQGYIEEAAIKLYDQSEIVFINRDNYKKGFKPGYRDIASPKKKAPLFGAVDHIASEVRVNESGYWTNYLSRTIGTELVQSIESSADNTTGMVLNINQSADGNLTMVIAEPEKNQRQSKVQKNIDAFGPGIHHLAFSTNDLQQAIAQLTENDVEFVSFPRSYYQLLRANDEFRDIDIDSLEQHGILIDKEDDKYLLQKFIKPISDRPFFFYEIVQRVNGYKGFALKNINVLKKSEEMEIMKA